MNKKDAIDLINRYLSGTCTEQEKLLVETTYNEQYSAEDLPFTDTTDPTELKEQILLALRKKDAELKRKKGRLLLPTSLKAAAAILAILAVGGASYWIFFNNHHPGGSPQNLAQEIGPGSNKAILTLSNGSKIELDDLSKGDVAKVSGITVKKNHGKIIYTLTDDEKSSTAADEVNTITTPKGAAYELILQDGTQVWLNADSKITFPVSFKGRDRREVSLSGEAYFQVTHNSRQPFLVRSTVQLVTVTGTRFNVSCYPYEKTLTTLAAGSVVVSQAKTGKQEKLTPGKQSTVTTDAGILIKNVHPEDYISWKDDYFVFVQTPIKEVLAQLGRWYNVSIDESNIPSESFDGRISRRIPLSQAMHLLELNTDMKFNISGRKIMVR